MRLPGQNSLKYPIVLVTFAPPGKRAETNKSTPQFTLTPDRLNDRVVFGDEVFGVVPAIHYVKSARIKKYKGTISSATLSLFDPDFDNLLTRMAAFAAPGSRYGRMYVRYGWLTGSSDGLPLLSGNAEYGITEIDASFSPDGCELEISGVDGGMYDVATQQVSGVAVLCDDLPGHEVVRQILETNYTKDSLYRPPRVVVEVPLAPLQLHGNSKHLIIQNTTPWAYCKQLVTGLDEDQNAVSTPKLLPADPALRDRSVVLIPDLDDNGDSIVRIALSSPTTHDPPARTYTYGRGIDGNVLSFRASDNGVFATALGLRGPMQAVLPDGSFRAVDTPSNDAIQPGPDIFAKVSAAGNVQTLEARRQFLWADASRITVQADMTVVGDPNLRLMDLVQFNLLGGGTLANLGGYVDTVDSRRGDAVRAIPGISNVYTITELEHSLEGGNFTTNVKMFRHIAPKVSEEAPTALGNTDYGETFGHVLRRGREIL